MLLIHTLLSKTPLSITAPSVENLHLIDSLLTYGDFMLVTKHEFSASDELPLRWRGPRKVIKAINVYIQKVEDLRNDDMDYMHLIRLKFYSNLYLDTETLISHSIHFDTVIIAQLSKLVNLSYGFMVEFRLKGLPESEDTLVLYRTFTKTSSTC